MVKVTSRGPILFVSGATRQFWRSEEAVLSAVEKLGAQQARQLPAKTV